MNLRLVYDGPVKTRAAGLADIRKNVHSSADVWREARQVENDAQYGSKYYELYRAEVLTAAANTSRVNAEVLGLI